jgi:hypothetical protein
MPAVGGDNNFDKQEIFTSFTIKRPTFESTFSFGFDFFVFDNVPFSTDVVIRQLQNLSDNEASSEEGKVYRQKDCGWPGKGRGS